MPSARLVGKCQKSIFTMISKVGGIMLAPSIGLYPPVLLSLKTPRKSRQLCTPWLFPVSVSHSVVSGSLQPNGLQGGAHQAPLSTEFSRQEYWSGLPFPSPRDLPDPGIKPMSPALQADSSPSEPPEKPSKGLGKGHSDGI